MTLARPICQQSKSEIATFSSYFPEICVPATHLCILYGATRNLA
jgi:hypothetical protein